MGYIRVYDLEDYYALYGSVPSNAKKPKMHHYEKYPFLRLQRLIQYNHSQHSKFDAEGGREFGFAPLLLNCFRAHMGALLKVTYSNETEIVVTAARHGSVRLWKTSGTYLGHLGTDEIMPKFKHMPPDIQAIASPLTLHTGIHFRRKTDFFPVEDTTKFYSGFEPEPTRLQAEGHSHHTGWETMVRIPS
ncbi:WD_REPEATS_REGION domain-containing protein [Trichonephila clavipes]|nr:WD_REPEATS_REGION domain-containing protein [Trichonephila clavipes]